MEMFYLRQAGSSDFFKERPKIFKLESDYKTMFIVKDQAWRLWQTAYVK